MSASDPGPQRAWIGLGSNLDDAAGHLRRAIDELKRLEGLEFLALSSLYRTQPWGHADQADFINAVALVRTRWSAHELLDALLAIEQAMGRERRGERWGPRLIDLDLLLLGEQQLSTAGLQIPHPRMHLRRFVLEPLLELSPGLVIPGVGEVADCLQAVQEQSVTRLEKIA